jgi:hypothetical protein
MAPEFESSHVSSNLRPPRPIQRRLGSPTNQGPFEEGVRSQNPGARRALVLRWASGWRRLIPRLGLFRGQVLLEFLHFGSNYQLAISLSRILGEIILVVVFRRIEVF